MKTGNLIFSTKAQAYFGATYDGSAHTGNIISSGKKVKIVTKVSDSGTFLASGNTIDIQDETIVYQDETLTDTQKNILEKEKNISEKEEIISEKEVIISNQDIDIKSLSEVVNQQNLDMKALNDIITQITNELSVSLDENKLMQSYSFLINFAI